MFGKISIFFLMTFFSLNVHADRCSSVSEYYAQRTAQIFKNRVSNGQQDEITLWCHRCHGEEGKRKAGSASSVRAVFFEESWRIEIDGSPVDLAYVYVNGVNIITFLHRQERLLPSFIEESYCLEGYNSRTPFGENRTFRDILNTPLGLEPTGIVDDVPINDASK